MGRPRHRGDGSDHRDHDPLAPELDRTNFGAGVDQGFDDRRHGRVEGRVVAQPAQRRPGALDRHLVEEPVRNHVRGHVARARVVRAIFTHDRAPVGRGPGAHAGLAGLDRGGRGTGQTLDRAY